MQRIHLVVAACMVIWVSPASNAQVPATDVRTVEECAPACRVPAENICGTSVTEPRKRCIEQIVDLCVDECVADLGAGVAVSIPHDLSAAQREQDECLDREHAALEAELKRTREIFLERKKACEKQQRAMYDLHERESGVRVATHRQQWKDLRTQYKGRPHKELFYAEQRLRRAQSTESEQMARRHGRQRSSQDQKCRTIPMVPIREIPKCGNW